MQFESYSTKSTLAVYLEDCQLSIEWLKKEVMLGHDGSAKATLAKRIASARQIANTIIWRQ